MRRYAFAAFFLDIRVAFPRDRESKQRTIFSDFYFRLLITQRKRMASLGDDVLLDSFLIVGPMGLLANTFLLVIVLRKKELRQGEYMPFIINRTLIDIAFCLHLIILQPIGVRYWSTDPIYSKIAGWFALALIMSFVFSEVVLAFNRYISICHRYRYQKIYKRRRVYLMCVLIWFFGALIASLHITNDSLGRVSGYICSVKLETKYMLFYFSIDFFILSVTYGVLTFCYRKIYIL